MRILGIDPSLTSTGVAKIWTTPSGPGISVHRVQSGPPRRARGDKRPATIQERAARVRTITTDVLAAAWTPSTAQVLAVVEAPSYGSQGAGTWDRAWLWGSIISALHANDVGVAIVPPSTRAIWATGSGAAGKSPIAVHLSRMWPDLDPDGVSDDEWDAAALATIGAQHLGVLPVELARHREQLAKVTWPDIPAGVAA